MSAGGSRVVHQKKKWAIYLYAKLFSYASLPVAVFIISTFILDQPVWQYALWSISAYILANGMEWFMHRYPMHARFPLLNWAFEAHTGRHHAITRSDRTYYCQNDHEASHVQFSWYAPFVALSVHCGVFVIPFGLLGGAPAICGMVSAFTVQYLLYEFTHWYMHMPGNKWFERTRYFQLIKKLHWQHHRSVQTNFNVAVPLADLVLGTLKRPNPNDARYQDLFAPSSRWTASLQSPGTTDNDRVKNIPDQPGLYPVNGPHADAGQSHVGSARRGVG